MVFYFGNPSKLIYEVKVNAYVISEKTDILWDLYKSLCLAVSN